MTLLTLELSYNNRKWCAAWLVSVLFIVKLVLLQRAEVDVVKSLMRKCLDGKVFSQLKRIRQHVTILLGESILAFMS